MCRAWAHSGAQETVAGFPPSVTFFYTCQFQFPVCGAGGVRYRLHKTGRETEAQGSEGTHSHR